MFRLWCAMAPLLASVALTSVVAQCPFSGSKANPIEAATATYYKTSGTYDDSNERLLEKLGITKVHSLPLLTPKTCGVQACNETEKYRRYDGSCLSANLKGQPAAGASGQCHRRLLAAAYADGVSQPVVTRPDPVIVYNALQNSEAAAKPAAADGAPSSMWILFEQFVAHDVTDTRLSSIPGKNADNFDCCSSKNQDLPQCAMRINMRKATTYNDQCVNCMSFLRQARCPCSAEATRTSQNMQSAAFDLSHIYQDGKNRDAVHRYRFPTTVTTIGEEYPLVNDNPAVCYGDVCFKGDGRMNQQPGLLLFHIMAERLHNHIADQIKNYDPLLDDNVVFEEARRIAIARYQYVVANEMFQPIMADALLRKWKLHIDQLVNGTKPDSLVDPVTYVESVCSEFRVHHAVPNTFGERRFYWADGSFYMNKTRYGHRVAREMWSTPANARFPMQPSVASEMMKRPENDLGLSMLLYNIVRNRDCGLPSYRVLVEWAHNAKVASFDDLAALNIFSEANLRLLRDVYANDIDQVDMYVGSHLEEAYGGKTRSFSNQMIRIRQQYGQVYGDRFFFSHEGVFTPKQRALIVQTSSIAQLLCETLDLKQVAKTPFKYFAKPQMVNCLNLDRFSYDDFVAAGQA